MFAINYIKIFKDAWEITWHHKYLWWLGFFVALSGAGGNLNFSFDQKNGSEFEEKYWPQVQQFYASHETIVVAGLFIVFILIISLLVLGLISRAGLILSIQKILKNEPLPLKSALSQGKAYFWKMFFLSIVIGIILLSILIILATPVVFLFINKSYVFGTLLAILAALLFIPLVVLTAFSKIYAQLYIVLGNIAVWPSLENAYDLFRKNISASVIMGMLFIALSIAFGLGLLALLLPIAITFLLLSFFFYAISANIALIITAATGILIALAIALFAKSVFETFSQTVWVLFFREIASPKVEERVAEKEAEKEEESLPAATPVKTAKVEK